jgi:hypothetical protein
MSKYRFFAYDPETGFETFETAEKAIAHAEDCIQCYRDEAPDGWNEQVDQVCWGEIRAETVEVGRREASEDEANRFEYWCDYALKDVTDEPMQEQKA